MKLYQIKTIKFATKNTFINLIFGPFFVIPKNKNYGDTKLDNFDRIHCKFDINNKDVFAL